MSETDERYHFIQRAEPVPTMHRDQLLDLLRSLANARDIEASHATADDALLEYINDPEISAAFNALEKWYA